MLELSAFARRTAQAAQDLADAVSIGGPPQPAPPPPGAAPRPPGPPLGGMPPPMPPGPTGALQGASGPPSGAGVTTTSPLEMMPAFKSPTFASMLQGEVGRQGGGPGFAKGGRVQRDLAVGGPTFDFSCR